MDLLFYQQALSGMYGAFIMSVRSLLGALAVGPSLTLPSSCTGWGGTALHAVPCLATLSLQQVPFSLALLFFLLPSPLFAKQAPGGPSLCCHCFPVSITLLQTWLQGVFSPSPLCHQDILCLQVLQSMFQELAFQEQELPMPIYAMSREGSCAGEKQRMPGQWVSVEAFHINSDPCQGVAVTLNSLRDNSTRKTPSLPLLAGLWNTGTALELGHWQLSRY